MVMEFACQGDLGQFVMASTSYLKGEQRNKRFVWAKRVIYKLCGILKGIHEAGFVYRDLKPENIIFTHKGELKLTDFGLVIREGVTDLSLCGTPSYMPPERLEFTKIKEEPVSRSCDLWSLGILAYELLTGELPYSCDSPS